MKILAIHNFHRKGSASGDDQVFRNETALLESYGNTIIKYTVSNDEFDKKRIFGKILSLKDMLWSTKHYRAVRGIINKECPDLVHVHTFFPLLSPSVLYAAKRSGCKVVATLHDTRLICPCATSLRGGKLCNQCSDGRYLRMVRFGCFKNSRLQSLLVAAIFRYHRNQRSFYEQIDQYICLNETQKNLLCDAGFEEQKINKKYNFVKDPTKNASCAGNKNLPERYVVFYGRIGREKGIYLLMQIWDRLPDIPLVVMGSGPLEKEFALWAQKKENVYFLGYTAHEECLPIVKKAEFIVFPSIWYEGCSMVEIEAESLGKGLVATNLGFSAEAIENGVNGYKISRGDKDGFAQKIQTLWNSPEECRRIGKNARIDYENKYTPEKNYRDLRDLYNKTLAGR